MSIPMPDTLQYCPQVTPDWALPTQLLDRRQRVAEGPRALWLAVLQSALHDIEHYAHHDSQRAQRIVADARAWIASDEGWPCSFPEACAVAGLDAQAVREQVGL